MKKLLATSIITLITQFTIFSQIAINSTGARPNPAAMLDVNSSTKGFLPPRMTTAQRLAILPQPSGLIIFDTNTQSLWISRSDYYWEEIFSQTVTPNTTWTTNSNSIFNTNLTGRVGIKTNNPSRKLEVFDGSSSCYVSVKATSGYSTVDIDGFNGDAGLNFKKAGIAKWSIGNNPYNDNFEIVNTAGLSKIMTISNTTNNVAFGNGSLLNKVDIGYAPGYFGNTLAIGNGTKGMAFYLAPTAATLYSDSNLSMMPVGSGLGYLGIGTTTPLAPLHVTSFSAVTGSGPYVGGRGIYFNTTTDETCNYDSGVYSCYELGAFGGLAFSSILAEGDIITKFSLGAFASYTASDARIKNIIGLSNTEEDLSRLNKIQITNYRMKDKATWGDETFKKVIAQQVESVYPEAIKKAKSVIPDIYTLAETVAYNTVEKTLSVLLSRNYDIKIGDRIQLVHPEKGEILSEVTAVSGNTFTVKNWEYNTDKVFVFGREVDDFRTVDYDALSILAISAIQQLDKENEELITKLKSCVSKLDAIEASLKQTTILK
jgi:hypothetical protein